MDPDCLRLQRTQSTVSALQQNGLNARKVSSGVAASGGGLDLQMETKVLKTQTVGQNQHHTRARVCVCVHVCARLCLPSCLRV